MSAHIGTIIGGSLREGLVMRLLQSTTLTAIKTGNFVTIKDKNTIFFAIITDLSLQANNPQIMEYELPKQTSLLGSVIRSHNLYVNVHIHPILSYTYQLKPTPIKTIPSHLSPVYNASEKDFAHIFGKESDPRGAFFHIGSPIDLDTPLCIDLEKLTERSIGIFGKTGTGKTFLTRLILAGTIAKKRSVNLIFDMHSEYGLQARQEGSAEPFVKGLKTLFPTNVVIFSLDPETTRKRGASPDVYLTISYQDIEIEDILSLQEELNLHPTAIEAAYLISACYKKEWLSALLSNGETIKTFSAEIGAHPESIAALYRKLKRLERLPFIKKEITAGSIVERMLEYLDKDINVIVEFGNFSSSFVYLLVANIITRRIHARYIKKTEQFLGSKNKSDQPNKLLITIEEAHKFLNTQAAKQTIFGTIAREMRKYYVSLLVVDQRPSAIDQEIMSQIGTRLVAQLSNDQDIQAVLSGEQNGNTLKTMLAGLESKKQVLLFGHALPIPITIESRSYNEAFYKAIQNNPATITAPPEAFLF